MAYLRSCRQGIEPTCNLTNYSLWGELCSPACTIREPRTLLKSRIVCAIFARAKEYLLRQIIWNAQQVLLTVHRKHIACAWSTRYCPRIFPFGEYLNSIRQLCCWLLRNVQNFAFWANSVQWKLVHLWCLSVWSSGPKGLIPRSIVRKPMRVLTALL